MKIAKQLTAAEIKELTKRPGNHAVGGIRGLLLKALSKKEKGNAKNKQGAAQHDK